MILEFPNLETLAIALSSGVVPREIAAQPAEVRMPEDGRVLVSVEGVPRTMATALKQLGVKGRRAIAGDDVRQVDCWPQILPLQADPHGIPDDDKTAVLFEFPDDGLLPEVVNEVLRLGNDRQSYRAFQIDDESRILLKIIGPPYYSMLRALERNGSASGPRAFVERNDRVWVQVGFTHPLAERFQPPPGKVLLIASPGEWRFLEEGRFRDIYDAAEFSTSDGIATLHAVESNAAISVPLKLVRGGNNDVAELWVLDENGPAQLEAFTQSADDALISRLSFAVAEHNGKDIVILRLRPGKGSPPVLVLDALACCLYLKLPNLFVPAGRRLHPPLRRDVVKSLLAADLDAVTWLTPLDDGEFVPRTLPDSAFRPLSDWVRYVLDREHEPLQAWVQSTRFNFEPFICPDDKRDQPKPPRKQREKTPAKKPDKTTKEGEPADKKKGLVGRLFGKKRKAKTEQAKRATPRQREPSEIEKRLRSLQREFLESQEPLDAPPREDQWRELATLNSALLRHNDASACWSHAFWETETPAVDELANWYRAEARHWEHAERLFDNVRAVEHHFDDLLSAPNPEPSAVNAAAVFLIWHTASGNANVEFNAQLAGLQQLFEKHELFLPVRTAWLTWRALSTLAGDDLLMLARARERILDRLLQRGLVPNQDLPRFCTTPARTSANGCASSAIN